VERIVVPQEQYLGGDYMGLVECNTCNVLYNMENVRPKRLDFQTLPKYM
jgi:hypothetical protein